MDFAGAGNPSTGFLLSMEDGRPSADGIRRRCLQARDFTSRYSS